MKKQKEMEVFELLLYYIFNVLTFGVLYLYKIVVKKAMSEMQ